MSESLSGAANPQYLSIKVPSHEGAGELHFALAHPYTFQSLEASERSLKGVRLQKMNFLRPSQVWLVPW